MIPKVTLGIFLLWATFEKRVKNCMHSMKNDVNIL